MSDKTFQNKTPMLEVRELINENTENLYTSLQSTVTYLQNATSDIKKLFEKINDTNADIGIIEDSIKATTAFVQNELDDKMPTAPSGGGVWGGMGNVWYQLVDVEERAVILLVNPVAITETDGLIEIDEDDFADNDTFWVHFNGAQVHFIKGEPITELYQIGTDSTVYKFVFNDTARTVTVTEEAFIPDGGTTGGATPAEITALINAAIATHNTAANAHENRFSQVNNSLAQANDRIDVAATDISSLNTRVGTAEASVTGLGTRVTTAEQNITSITGRVSNLEGLGFNRGVFATFAAVPDNESAFAEIFVNDFIHVSADETRGGLPTRYIASAIDGTTGEITWQHHFTFSLDITGKMDLVPTADDDNVAIFKDGQVIDSGKKLDELGGGGVAGDATVKPFTVLAAAWTGISTVIPGFTVQADIADSDVLSNSNVNIVFSPESTALALRAGVMSAGSISVGAVRLYARRRPTVDLDGGLIIFG